MNNERWTSSDSYQSMAWHPSRFAPSAADIHRQFQTDKLPDILVRSGSKDIVLIDHQVSSVSLTGQSFLTFGGQLLTEQPIQEIRLIACAFLVGLLSGCKHWQRVQRLSLFGNQLRMDRLRLLLQQGRLAHLEAVDLRQNGLSEQDGIELREAFPLASATNSIRL